jgi:hypothetical protein
MAPEGERGLETLVTVTFLEEGGRTRMTFRQVPFQSVEERTGIAAAGRAPSIGSSSISPASDSCLAVVSQFEI